MVTGEGRPSWRERALGRGLDPVLVVELLQNAKAALAGVLAWVVARDVLGLEQPFLAPWAAVLVVHATVYRTVSRGGQQVGATFAGVFVAWGCGSLFGVGPLGMGVMLVASFLLGRHRWLRDEATTIATTGIVVLATNAIGESNLLASRLLDTTVGVVVGLLVNLLVWPPLRDRAAWARADALPLGWRRCSARWPRGWARTWSRPTPNAGCSDYGCSTSASTRPGASCGRPRRAAG